MAWTQLDDNLHAHPKVRAAWQASPAALGLWTLALSYSNAYLTDGHVPESFVRDQLPSPAARRKAVAALVDSGLWQPNGTGWIIHDYLVYNRSREKVIEARRKASVLKQSQRDKAKTGAGR